MIISVTPSLDLGFSMELKGEWDLKEAQRIHLMILAEQLRSPTFCDRLAKHIDSLIPLCTGDAMDIPTVEIPMVNCTYIQKINI